MKHLFCIAVLLGSASLSACAQAPQPDKAAATAPAAKAVAPAAVTIKPGSAEDRARQGLQKLNPDIQVDYIGAAPLPGFREVIVGGQLVYVSDDGKYLLQGSLFDMSNKKDLTEARLGGIRKELVDQVAGTLGAILLLISAI